MAFAPLRWVRRALSKPAKAEQAARRSFVGGMTQSGAALNGWTDSRIDQVRAYRHWTYVAVSLIADRVAMQAPNVGRRLQAGEPTTRRLSRLQLLKALSPTLRYEQLEPVGNDHPLVRLLADPNDPDTGYDLWFETVLFLLLTGNAYWWVPKNKLGLPAAIWVLPAHWVWPVFAPDASVEAYEIRPVEGQYLKRRFPADEVIHFRKKNPTSKFDGHSPQTAIAPWLDIQQSVDRSRWFTFKNGGQQNVAIEFDPQVTDPTDDDLARIEAKYLSRYAGETRAGKPLLCPPGTKVKPLLTSPREFDYCESADQLRDNILAAYKIPTTAIGLGDGLSAQTITAADNLVCARAINPLCRQLGMVLTEKLAPLYGDDLRLWWDDSTPNDPEMVEKQIKTDLSAMAISPNEIRQLRGREPYENGGWDPFAPNIGLVLPWFSGEDINAVNPFTHLFGTQDKPGKKGTKEEEEDTSKEE